MPSQTEKVTAVLFVDRVEPSVRFWVERMGFTAAVEIPGAHGLAFALLQNGDSEIMLQARRSAENEPEAIRTAAGQGPTFLYIEVADLTAALSAMEGVEIVKPVFSTFYGAREFVVREPGGHLITFAQQGAAQ